MFTADTNGVGIWLRLSKHKTLTGAGAFWTSELDGKINLGSHQLNRTILVAIIANFRVDLDNSSQKLVALHQTFSKKF